MASSRVNAESIRLLTSLPSSEPVFFSNLLISWVYSIFTVVHEDQSSLVPKNCLGRPESLPLNFS